MSIVLLFVYNMLAELEELDESRGWPRLFERLNWEASQKAGALTAARLPENRQLNRYRDVLPYDHSRIILKGGSPDYINANLVEITRLNKKYILTQGPLPHTAMHFWQMIWEQNTEAVVMLNRVVEKNQIKCYQYWPCGEAHGHVSHLEFGDFRIYYLREMRNEYFTIRSLELENVLTGERRNIEHFHYLTWPDFGVPTSPATFLAFLFEVRKTGVMSADAGPCVIHCSAGIGRSGTFVMVDLILTEVERTGDMDQIDIKAMLLEIRQSRVGLIQTPDQLRFTYLAILEGVRVLMPEIYQTAQNHNEQRDAEEEEETPPPLPERRRLVATDEPATKKSRTSDHEPEPEPEPEKEVFSDNSEGSDEIINLSSLSESESEEDTNKVQNEEPSFVQAELQQTMQDHQPIDMKHQSTEEGQQHTKEVIQPTDDTPQHPEEGSLQSTDEGCQLAEKDLPLTSEGRQKTREAPAPTDHETKEGLVSTDEGCKETEEDLEPTVEGCQHLEEGVQPSDGVCQHLEEGVEPTVEGCQHLEEGVQPSDDGGVDKTDSITQIRKRRREERKQKVADLVENIKKNVKREEDAKVWKSRLKNSLMVVAVCSLAYITFRYFTSG